MNECGVGVGVRARKWTTKENIVNMSAVEEKTLVSLLGMITEGGK